MSTLAFGKAVRDEPIESIDQLAALFRRSFKSPAQHRVGLEIEELPARADGSAVPHDAAQGPSIRALLEKLGPAARMQPVLENGNLIGLQGASGVVSLEPGGQVEFSSAPAASLHELAALAGAHTRRLREIGAGIGIRWADQGYQPIARLSAVEWMPKERYRIMRAYLSERGRLALRMMGQTAALQCSFDFANEQDWQRKFRAAHVLTPLAQAIFANSPFRNGRPNGFLSYRTRVWEQTDAQRCGFLPEAFSEQVSIEDYVRYALDVPMMFLIRKGSWLPMKGYSFRRFMEKGYEGSFPTTEDWGLHLSGIFIHVRLKSYIEVRSQDLLPPPLRMSVPALWKGILYDREALEAAMALVGRMSRTQAEALMVRVSRLGLGARHDGRPLLETARELVRISSEGLRRQRRRLRNGQDETLYLEPIEELLSAGRTPAEELLARYEGEWKRDLRRSLSGAASGA
jgi:glutamate--cysteine ligase